MNAALGAVGKSYGGQGELQRIPGDNLSTLMLEVCEYLCLRLFVCMCMCMCFYLCLCVCVCVVYVCESVCVCVCSRLRACVFPWECPGNANIRGTLFLLV